MRNLGTHTFPYSVLWRVFYRIGGNGGGTGNVYFAKVYSEVMFSPVSVNLLAEILTIIIVILITIITYFLGSNLSCKFLKSSLSVVTFVHFISRFSALKDPFERLYVMFCVIWYHLYNLKNVKKYIWRSVTFFTCNFATSNTPPWVFFTFLKLHKRYQILQSIT